MAIHNLVITVVDGGKASSSNVLADNDNKTNTDRTNQGGLQKILNYNQVLKSKLQQETPPTTYFALEMGSQIAKQTLTQTANYFLSDIGRSNGDSNYQAQVNRTVEIVGDVMSVGTGALSGMAAGSMFGPIGSAIGAALGAVSSVVNIGFKYAERERAYQHEMFKNNNSQAYNLARANYSIWTGRAR